MELISLQNGQKATIFYKDGMFRSIIAGKNYCGQTRQLLLNGISYSHPIIERVHEVADTRSASERLANILYDPKSKLAEKQEAFSRLMPYAEVGDEIAVSVMHVFEEKPRPSREAQHITIQLEKPDFAFVTPVELTENIHNLVLRSRLIQELGNRLTF